MIGTAQHANPDSEVRLSINGMTCAGCAASVQRAIEAQPGVTEASVSVTDGLARVVGEGLDPAGLIAAVTKRGFQAHTAQDTIDLRSEIERRQQRTERQWRWRAIIGLGLWVPMELLHWLGPAAPAIPWVLCAGATVVLATVGWGFYRSAAAAARRRTTNMDTLIALGATTAYVFSLVVLIAKITGRLTEQPLYFTEAAALLGIISLGHWLEARSTAKAGSAVRELLELQPDRAERLDDTDTPTAIPAREVRPGDRLLIRPGGRVPVDGRVVEGSSAVDESVVTGESLPVDKSVGDPVVAGALNTVGRLVVEATVDGRHTTIARIAEMVQNAQASKAGIQRLADRVCAIFVPAVMTVAAITFLGWLIAGDPATGIVATVTVLIISCPCALGLATPMAVMVGAGAASRRGILVKNASALERAGRAGHVVLDKTGTLTSGRPVLVSVEPEGNWSEAQLLEITASAEAPSEHPIARAIVEAAVQRGLRSRAAEEFRAVPGAGVEAVIDGMKVQVLADDRATCRVLVDGVERGRLTVADRMLPDAPAAIQQLKAMGIEVTMLTGDRPAAAKAIAMQAGLPLESVRAQATPESKNQYIAQLTAGSDGRSVVMVGDGINDAAALAQADLGIAIASGTNIAIESADVVIPRQQITAVPETIAIARDTLTTIKQNLFFAFLYNVCAIPMAALGLLGAHGPIIAALAMAGSDLTVIGNALRLKRRLGKRGQGQGHGQGHGQRVRAC